ncbi:MAG: ATP-binding protein [Methylacidiphilales bacterium]|nr:ATP-binding protein [Candidatus Methylacidiphilales bacterium]
MNDCRSSLIVLIVLLLVMTRSFGADETGGRKNVLILYGERLDLPAVRILEQTFHDQFGAANSPAVDLFPEYFDFARFPVEQEDAILTPYLRYRYAGRKIDLVVPVTGLALNFALRHRDDLFPAAPIVFLVLNPKDVPAQLPPDTTGVSAHQDIPGTVGLALRLQPDARELVVISGASELDRKLLRQMTPVFDGLAGRIKWRAIAGRSLSETIDEVGRLPRNDVVLVLSMISDSKGRALSIPEITRQLAVVSPAPIYGVTDTILGSGAVGGAVIDFATLGRQTSDLALDVLRGQPPAGGLLEANGPDPLFVDWRALKHWNLPASRVPAEATVLFRTPTLWEQHYGLILGIIAVCLVQTATITGLLVQRARRRRLEGSLREREQQIDLASRSANIGLWVRNVVSGEVYATEKFRKLFGFMLDEKLNYEAVLGRIHSDDRASMKHAMEQAIAGRTFYDTQYRVMLPDGAERWIHSIGQAEYSKSGKPVRTLGVSIDITQNLHFQSEVKELRYELAHVDRVTMLGQLATALAHELSQPLGAILRNAEAAELFLKMEKPDVDEVLAILGDIRSDDRRAGDVIDRMREMMKHRNLESAALDVAALARDVTSLIRVDAATRRIDVKAEIPDGLPPLQGDRVQLQQVLLNLILNAMDAVAGRGDGERSVVVRACRNGANLVEISVSDTGHGIPTDKLGKLFEPFFTTKASGMGIGLAISRTIVGAHGGRIWAEDNVDRGATFRVALPIAGMEEEAA